MSASPDSDDNIGLRVLLRRWSLSRQGDGNARGSKFETVEAISTALGTYADDEELSCSAARVPTRVEACLISMLDAQRETGARRASAARKRGARCPCWPA